jgi:hypothetical protein
MTVQSCLAERPVPEVAMGATRLIFEFKCRFGHKTEQRFPPGTSYDAHPHIICMKCPQGVIERAYLIFACPEREKKSDVTGKA